MSETLMVKYVWANFWWESVMYL